LKTLYENEEVDVLLKNPRPGSTSCSLHK